MMNGAVKAEKYITIHWILSGWYFLIICKALGYDSQSSSIVVIVSHAH